jgi:hypothetical protein
VERRRQVDGENRVPLGGREVLQRCDELDAGLLTRTSSRPSVASVASIISAIDAGLDMSAAEYCTVTPNSSASLAWVAVISSGFPKPLSTTADPAAASARAMPSPIPLVEPVISDTRPASGRATANSSRVRGLFMTWLRG